MLVVADNLSTFTLGAGEPFLLQVEFQDKDGAPVDLGARAFVLSVYRQDRSVVQQLAGVRDSDSKGPFLRFEEDGAWSEGLFGIGGLKVELAELYLRGSNRIATGTLTIKATAASVPSLGSASIGAYAIRIVVKNSAALGGEPTFSQHGVPYIAQGATPTPAPGVPVFTTPPSISPATGTAGVTTFTASDGAASNASGYTRRWLLSGTAIGTGATIKTDAAGSLVLEVTAHGPGGDSEPAPSAAAAVAVAVSAAPGGSKFHFLYNVRGPASYIPSVPLNNWGKFVDIGPNYVTIPRAGINGTVTVQTDVGLTLATPFEPSVTTISSNPATGTHRLTVLRDIDFTRGANGQPVQDHRSIDVSGGQCTFFTVTRDGQTSKIAPEFTAGMEGEGFRVLDMVGANNVQLEGTLARNVSTDKLYVQGGGTGKYLPHDDITDLFAATTVVKSDFKYLWYVFGPDLTDADVTTIATYQRDTLPSSTLIALQFSNEDFWNNSIEGNGFTGGSRMAMDGLRYGHWGNATAAAPNPTRLNTSNGGGNANGPTLPGSYAQGDRIAFSMSGLGDGLWEAKQAVPPGTVVAENAYWTQLAGASPTNRPLPVLSYANTATRWQAVRLNQIDEIYRTVFGATRFAAQIRPVRMGQAQRPDISLGDQLKVERTYVPGFFDKIAGIGYAWYFDQGPTPSSSITTATQLEAALRANIPSVLTSIRTVFNDAKALGKEAWFYEGMTHPDLGAYGVNGGNNDYRRAWDAFFSSDAGAQYMTDCLKAVRIMAAKSGINCVLVGYDLVAGLPWSIKDTWADTANKRRKGILDGLAATLPATPATQPSTFKLSDLTTLAERFTAKSGVAADASGNVTSWTDSVGGKLATPSNDKPKLIADGWAASPASPVVPSIRMSATANQSLQANAASGSTFTMLFVINHTTDDDGTIVACGHSGFEIDHQGRALAVIAEYDAAIAQFPQAYYQRMGRHVIAARVQPSGAEIRVDGMVVGTTPARTFASGNYNIGGNPEGVQYFFKGDFAVAARCASYLSDVQIAAWEAYEMAEWGIVAPV